MMIHTKEFRFLRHPYRRRLLWCCHVLLLCLLVIAGCSTSNQPQGDTPRGGELRWAIVGVKDLSSLDPAHADEQQSIIVMRLIYGGLVRLDENLVVQPDGAERWDVSDDGKTYTFHLRKDLKFADGTPVMAQDFSASIHRALAPQTGAYSAPALFRHIAGAPDFIDGKTDSISGVQVVDDATLKITLDAPLAYFLSLLSASNMLLVPHQFIEQKGDAWTEQAFGTGPFRVKEWRHNEEIVLEANPNYWPGMPGIDIIRMPFFEDSETAYQQYIQGNIDICGNHQAGVPANRVAEAQALPGFVSASALAVRYIGFNNKLSPFDLTSVRQAFALAVDKTDLAERVLQDTVEPTSRILPLGLAGTKISVQGQSFDAQAARAALKLSGYLSGNELPPITLTYGEEGDNAVVAQALQTYWRDTLGVAVVLEGLPLQEFSQRLDETYQNPSNGLLMYLSIWGADYPDPQNFLSQQLLTDSPNNNGHWSDSTFDELVNRADRMGGYDERDERLKLYSQAEQVALDNVGWLPLYNPRMNILMRPSVKGLVFTPQDIIAPDWTKVRIATDKPSSLSGVENNLLALSLR